MTGAQSQHVASHGVELFGCNLDEPDAALLEEFDLAYRHERRIDHGEVMVERAQARHQMKDVRPSLVMGHVEPQDFNVVASKLTQLMQALEIGAVAYTGQQCVAINPDEIATLQHSVAGDLAGNWETKVFQGRTIDRRFRAPLRLSHARLDQTAGRHDEGVVGIDRVEREAVTRRKPDDLGARRLEDILDHGEFLAGIG